MFGISFSELITILVVAIFFLKPTEIKNMCRKILQWQHWLKQDLRMIDTLSDHIYNKKLSPNDKER